MKKERMDEISDEIGKGVILSSLIDFVYKNGSDGISDDSKHELISNISEKKDRMNKVGEIFMLSVLPDDDTSTLLSIMLLSLCTDKCYLWMLSDERVKKERKSIRYKTRIFNKVIDLDIFYFSNGNKLRRSFLEFIKDADIMYLITWKGDRDLINLSKFYNGKERDDLNSVFINFMPNKTISLKSQLSHVTGKNVSTPEDVYKVLFKDQVFDYRERLAETWERDLIDYLNRCIGKMDALYEGEMKFDVISSIIGTKIKYKVMMNTIS